MPNPQTLAAEKLVQQVWGDVSGSVQLMLEAGTRDELARRGDRLSRMLQQEIAAEGFCPASFLRHCCPAAKRRRENFAAWQRFWSPARLPVLKQKELGGASRDLGFAPDAFAPFFAMLASPAMPRHSCPMSFADIARHTSRMQTQTVWRQVLTLAPGPSL